MIVLRADQPSRKRPSTADVPATEDTRRPAQRRPRHRRRRDKRGDRVLAESKGGINNRVDERRG